MRDDAELRTTLERLHGLLETSRELDPDLRDRLRATLEDISGALERADGDEDGASLAERLGEFTEHFEEEHPSLAEVAGRLAAMLANLGI
jgi:hypothetical protein